MSALFNFNSFLTVVLLVICTCTYIKIQFPAILNDRTGRCINMRRLCALTKIKLIIVDELHIVCLWTGFSTNVVYSTLHAIELLFLDVVQNIYRCVC
ncbi:hypothetical protein DAI22_05g088100 [Oryza sativa Japonica Group]|nr:hypothetical protein DAI22_05g088100 [Oryza sativa Japonica Group]